VKARTPFLRGITGLFWLGLSKIKSAIHLEKEKWFFQQMVVLTFELFLIQFTLYNQTEKKSNPGSGLISNSFSQSVLRKHLEIGQFEMVMLFESFTRV